MLFSGIDWASDHHDLLVMGPDGQVLRKSQVAHSAEGFESLREQLGQLHAASGEIAIAVEMHAGPLILWLVDQGYQVFGINPRASNRARDSLSPSGAKDDQRDAFALAEFVRSKYALLRPLRAENPTTRTLRRFVRLREDLVEERTVQKQQLGAHLRQFAPELDQLLSPFRTEWSLEFLLQFPTMPRLKAAKPSQIRRLAKKHRMSGASLEALLALQKKPALPVPDDLDAPFAMEVEHRAHAIRHLDQAIEAIEQKIEVLLSRHPDANIIESLPSGGATTRGALWSGIESGALMCHNADELASCWGAAPITVQSGMRRSVRMRRACDQTQKQYLLWFAWATSRREDCWAKEFYDRKREDGMGHFSALRAVGRRWVRILWALFTTKTCYDESRVRRMACAPATT
jgi:transposase